MSSQPPVSTDPTRPGRPARAAPDAADWRAQLRGAIRDPAELLARLGLSADLLAGATAAVQQFPLVVPESVLSRMRPGDPHDPVLRQVLPLAQESAAPAPGFVADPVGDADAIRAPGLLHKYRGRALLIVAGVCAVACRYCFRRAFPYDEAPNGLEAWRPALATITADPSLEEIILSGGDPLMRSDAWLAQLAAQLDAIPHLRRLRVHTRLPIAIPARVDDALLGWLSRTRLAPTVVVHANHPAELDSECSAALLRLVKAGIPVLNQAVLLRGVNDAADTLEELSRRLLDARVMPYYLHQLDPVAGAGHFEVPVERGRQLVAELRARLPGYAVPRYVREVPGEPHKSPLGSD